MFFALMCMTMCFVLFLFYSLIYLSFLIACVTASKQN